MGRLEVSFRIGLAHPLMLSDVLPEFPIAVTFQDTGNTVRIDVPQMTSAPEQERLGVFGKLVLRVERQCTDEEGQDGTFANCRRLRIPSDAARAFWWSFEIIRYVEFHKDSCIAG